MNVVRDGSLSPPCHDQYILDPRLGRFFDSVLDERLINQWEHPLGGGLGGGKKTGAKAGGRDHRSWDETPRHWSDTM